MGYDPSAVGYAAAYLNDLFGSRTDVEKKTKYDEDTGKPYEVEIETEMVTWPSGEMTEEEFEDCDLETLLPDGIAVFDTNYEGEGPKLAGVELLDMNSNGFGEWPECDPEDLQEAVDDVKKKLADAGWPDAEVRLHFGLFGLMVTVGEIMKKKGYYVPERREENGDMPTEVKLKRMQALALVCVLLSMLVVFGMYFRIRGLRAERDRLNAELDRSMRLGAMMVEPDSRFK